jgi:hypothetical protein
MGDWSQLLWQERDFPILHQQYVIESHFNLGVTSVSTDRLVDCSPLKKGFEAFYSTLLAKGGQPFIYLSLQLSPDKIDVNVHPTKSEVLFEDQDEIVQVIVEALGTRLAEQSTSRSLGGGRVQTLSFLTPDDNCAFVAVQREAL